MVIVIIVFIQKVLFVLFFYIYKYYQIVQHKGYFIDTHQDT